MYRLRGDAKAALIACLSVGFAGAQPAPPASEPIEPAGEVEAYLAEHNLPDLRAAHLRAMLEAAEGEERRTIAERLGRLYASRISDAKTPAERAEIERRGRELLERVPGSDSFDLRLTLGRATYLRAEQLAERHRIGLTTDEEAEEARTTLREASESFGRLADRVQRRVEVLERRESRGGATGGSLDALRSLLTDVRRQRSLAMYYAGWSTYYLALLTDRADLAADARIRFGYLLNGEGQSPTLERLPKGLLRYEHVARAAVGVALASSLMGEHGQASMWLDAVDEAEQLPEPVRDQLFRRRLTILAEAGRWSTLRSHVDQRIETRTGEEELLATVEARLLAVRLLESRSRTFGGARGEARAALLELALSSLVRRGEIGHVLDLIDRYGTLPLGNEGFIVRYVRGVRSYESARNAHRAAGVDAQKPTDDVRLQGMYHDASRALAAAIDAEDAGDFSDERGRATLLRGLSLFYKGDAAEASRAFERASSISTDQSERAEAVWLAIVAAEDASERGTPDMEPRVEQLSALFIDTFPEDERAARLVLRTAGGARSDEQAVEILLSVPPEAAIYRAARLRASGILYRMYRTASPGERSAAAARFMSVASAFVRGERRRIETSGTADADEVQQIVGLMRQMLHVSVSPRSPDLARARELLDGVDRVLEAAGLAPGSIGPSFEHEIAFRRLQLAAAEGDAARVDSLAEKLAGVEGPYAEAADRYVFRWAVGRFKENPGSMTDARRVVRHGARVMAAVGGSVDAFAARGIGSVAESVASAARAIWQAEGDTSMRDLAIRVDGSRIEAGRADAASLRRYASMTEEAGQLDETARAWRRLSAATEAPNPAWFEARYNLIRVLSETDPELAAQTMEQHAALHPEYGPAPWGAKLRALREELRGGAVAAAKEDQS